jgi:RND family efflux transporter MFP subunit
MKSIYYKLFAVVLSISVVACTTDKQAQLNKLKKQQESIAEQIKKLDSEVTSKDTANTVEYKGRKVAVTELKNQSFKHYIEVQGKLDGDDNVGISAKTMGVVEAVYVKVGDKVSKGQLLAKIDDKVLSKNMSDLKNKLDFATDIYNKQKALWDQKIGSEVQYLTAKNNKESLENSIRTLNEQIDMYRITSPITGSVGDAPLKVGQAVSPGLPIFRVISFSSIKVVAEVAESYSVKVNPGDAVIVYFPDLHQEVPATVSAVSQYINPVSRTFQVEVRLKNADKSFKANMISVLKINDYKADNTIAIPVNMVQSDMNGSFVYVAITNSPPKAQKVMVKTGLSYNGIIEIREGLKAGDKVITSGYLDVEDGQPIKF